MTKKHSKRANSITENALREVLHRTVSADQERKAQDKSNASLMSPYALMALGLAGAAKASVPSERNDAALQGRMTGSPDPVVVTADPTSMPAAADELRSEQADVALVAGKPEAAEVTANTAGDVFAGLPEMDNLDLLSIAAESTDPSLAPASESVASAEGEGSILRAVAGGDTLADTGINDVSPPIILAAASEAAAGAGAEAGAGATAAATGVTVGTVLAIVGGVLALGAAAEIGRSDSDAVIPPAPAPSSSGVVIDGLLAGATVFRDMDGDRILDTGESSTTSDATGAFVLSGSGGIIVATGGTDIATGRAFTGVLTAPDGATVVSPLTTLLAASNGALTATELRTAFGLTTDPLTFNPFAASANAEAALAAQQAIAQLENVLLRTGELMVAAGTAADLNAAFAAVATSFAAFADGRTGVDLADPTTLNAFFNSAPLPLLSAADQFAAVQYLDAVNSDIDAATNLASANLAQSLVDTTLNPNGYARVVSAHTIEGFAGTAASGNSIQITEGATVLGTGTVGTNGRFSITTTSTLAAGTHTLTITETATRGTPPTTTTVATASLTAIVDVSTGVPTLALATDSGTAGDSITNVGTVNVSGLETGATWAYSTNAGTSYTAGNGTSFALIGDGVKSVIVRQTDLAGNTADSAALGFTLDGTASAPTLALATNSGSTGDSITNVGTVNVSGLETGATWAYSTDAGANFATGTGTSFTLTGDGAKSVIVRQTDVAGNTSAASAAFAFTLDGTANAPTLALATDGGTAGDGLTNVGTVNVSGLEAGATWAYSTDAGANFTTGTGTSFTLTGDGAKSVIVRQTDVAGNTSATSAALGFTLDTSAPVLTPLSPADGGLTLGLAANLILSASETIAAGTGTLSLFKSDNTLVEAINVTSNQITISGTGNATQVSINPAADLINGQGYYIMASAGALVDTAGNAWAGITNATTWNFTGAGATVTIATVAGDNTVNNTESGATITVTGTLAAEAGVLAAYTVGDMTAVLRPATGNDIALTNLSYTGSTGAWSADIPASALSGMADYTLTVRFDGTTGLAAGISGLGTSTIHVDTVAPVAPTLALGTDSGSADSITNVGMVNVSGLEAGAAWAYSTDAGMNFTTGTGTSFTLTGDGAKSVIVRQTDVAGNTSAASAALAFTLDTTAPGAPTLALANDTGTSVGDGITNVGTVNVTGLEAGAAWAYSTNAGTSFTAGTGTSFTLTGDGMKSVIVRQTDVVGNTGAVSAAFVFTLDGTASAPTLALASDTGISASDRITSAGTVNVTGLEAGATWEYSTDGGTNFTPGTGTSFTLAGDGAKSVIARQTDLAGNASASSSAFGFTVDATAPTLTVSDNGGNASTGVFTYNFTFSEAVTGFDATDVAVVNGAKGTFSSTDASHYSLLVTPASSTAAQSMTVDVAGSAATDTAGNANSAAAQVLHSVLYGTANADSLTLGALADTVFLGAGNDVVRMTSATHSTAAALDRVLDFAAGDKLDLSAILGSGGVGYSSGLLPDTGAGFVELKNLTLTQGTSTTTVRFDIHFDAASILNSKITGAVIDLAYNNSVVSAAQAVSTQFTDPIFQTTTPVWSNVVSNLSGASANGKIALTADFNAANPIIDANGKVLSVTLIVNSLVSTFQVGLESGTAGSNTYITTADNVTHDVGVGITKTAGATAGTNGVLEIVADTGTLGAGDNQLHMLASFVSEHNLTHLQLSYDTNPAIGTTAASSLISMDFVGDVTANLIPANLIYI